MSGSGYPNNPNNLYSPSAPSYAPPPPSYAPPYSSSSSSSSPSAPSYAPSYAPPPSYAPQQPHSSDPYKPPKDPNKPPKDQHQYGPSYASSGGYGSSSSGYGASSLYGASSGYGAPSAYGGMMSGGGGGGGGGGPFAMLVPSVFPPGTDPNVIACFQVADQDGSGLIDDKELQGALSSYGQGFSMRTVHLLMYNFTNTNARKIGPKEFAPLFYSLQNWRSIFEGFDRDRSGKIDPSELREALLSLGYAVSPTVLELLVSKFDKTGGKSKAIEYDNFIECCLTVKGLTEKFKAKDMHYSGSATFAYEEFMLTVLPFLIA